MLPPLIPTLPPPLPAGTMPIGAMPIIAPPTADAAVPVVDAVRISATGLLRHQVGVLDAAVARVAPALAELEWMLGLAAPPGTAAGADGSADPATRLAAAGPATLRFVSSLGEVAAAARGIGEALAATPAPPALPAPAASQTAPAAPGEDGAPPTSPDADARPPTLAAGATAAPAPPARDRAAAPDPPAASPTDPPTDQPAPPAAEADAPASPRLAAPALTDAAPPPRVSDAAAPRPGDAPVEPARAIAAASLCDADEAVRRARRRLDEAPAPPPLAEGLSGAALRAEAQVALALARASARPPPSPPPSPPVADAPVGTARPAASGTVLARAGLLLAGAAGGGLLAAVLLALDAPEARAACAGALLGGLALLVGRRLRGWRGVAGAIRAGRDARFRAGADP